METKLDVAGFVQSGELPGGEEPIASRKLKWGCRLWGFTIEARSGPHTRGRVLRLGYRLQPVEGGPWPDGPVVWSGCWRDIYTYIYICGGGFKHSSLFLIPFLFLLYRASERMGFCRFCERREENSYIWRGKWKALVGERNGLKFLEEIYSRFNRHAILQSDLFWVYSKLHSSGGKSETLTSNWNAEKTRHLHLGGE